MNSSSQAIGLPFSEGPVREPLPLSMLIADVFVALTTVVSYEDMLKHCTDALVSHLNAAFARIWVVDSASKTLLLKASSGLYTHLNGPHARVPIGKFKIGLIAEERQPHLTNDVMNDPRVSDPEWARREGMVSFAGYPLLVEQQLMGVVALFSKSSLSSDTLQALASVANGIGLGIKRKQMESALQSMNDTLTQMVLERTTQLTQKEAELQHSRRLEAIGRLAGGVAHDFNNLLTGILGCTESLEDMIEDPFQRLELAEIKKAGERGASLTRQLLALSRQQIMRPQTLQLNSLIQDTSTLLRRLMGEDIELRLKTNPNLPSIMADAGQVNQVIMNIALNGRDAMPHGGVLQIETDTLTIEPDLPYADLPSGDYVMLTISDNGTGMTPAIKARIFEPFFTTKEQGKGTGLGLATAHGIVEQMEGAMMVYSQEGWGTVFKVLLPEALPGDSPIERSPSAQSDGTIAPGGTETLLVVEDEELVSAHIVRLLSRKGYQVVRANRPSEALRLFELHPDIALVLTDVVMPEMNGRELMTRIHQQRPDMKAIFMSGYPQEIISQKGVLDAGIEFIPKPFHSAALCQKIRDVLDR